MRLIRSNVSFILFLLSMPLCATNLPVEHESVRLLLAVEKSISESAWDKAQVQLGDLEKLDIDLPAKYHYFKGLAQNQMGDLKEAQVSLESYVIKAGSEGDFYTQALEMITEIDSAKKLVENMDDDKKTPEITASGDSYVQSLQALFLTDDPTKALILHANSLLTSHPYTGTRVKKQTTENGVVYRLSASALDLVVQEKRYIDGQPSLKVNKLNVSGIDPFIRYGCDAEEFACWILDPTDQYARWMIIDRDELVAQELAKALTKLIKAMQQ